MTARSKAVFLGGRAGAGKSSVGYEIHTQLSAARVRHCLIEGDNLDMAYPPPSERGLAAASVQRILRAYTRRVGDGDVEALALMRGLAEDIDAAIAVAVKGLRECGYS